MNPLVSRSFHGNAGMIGIKVSQVMDDGAESLD
jgi:hypothetical protein